MCTRKQEIIHQDAKIYQTNDEKKLFCAFKRGRVKNRKLFQVFWRENFIGFKKLPTNKNGKKITKSFGWKILMGLKKIANKQKSKKITKSFGGKIVPRKKSLRF